MLMSPDRRRSVADRVMSLQKRVTPEGEIIATPHRGLLMGNRGGAFHRPDRTLGHRRWHSRQWICCVLEFKGRRRAVMQPNRYTELFFLDEATALAAGHRPCFECRRRDAEHFAALWAMTRSRPGRRARAPDMDAVLHHERTGQAGEKVTYPGRLGDLPDGTFVRGPDRTSLLVLSGRLLPWTPAGYGPSRRLDPDLSVTVLTPRSIVAVLSAEYHPMLHPSAGADASRRLLGGKPHT